MLSMVMKMTIAMMLFLTFDFQTPGFAIVIDRRSGTWQEIQVTRILFFFTLKDGWFLSKEMLVNLDEDGVFLPYKIVVRDDKGS